MAKAKKTSNSANLLAPVFENSIYSRCQVAKCSAPRNEVLVFGGPLSEADKISSLAGARDWQLDRLRKKVKSLQTLSLDHAPLHLICLDAWNKSDADLGDLGESDYGIARDSAGQLRRSGLDLDGALAIKFEKCTSEQKIGFMVGLNLALYGYRAIQKGAWKCPDIYLQGLSNAQLEEAKHIGNSVQVGRHLVNLPAAELNPKTYADTLNHEFAKAKGFKVEIWDYNRLLKEGMGMHAAVGQAATEKPCLVHLSYRKKGAGKKPVALIGKGITFDSGGLDIKPAQAMRYMKKDMGGSAAVIGAACYVRDAQPSKNFDFYVALAENCADADSFRPGDILTARNGKTVEIDNTDAEGRLVLGDALCVASTRKEKPRYMIDVATLTGSIKVGLGATVPGLFSNNRALADKITAASEKMSEPVWHMPLVRKYRRLLHSTVADMANCAQSRFGGAITAALFLEEFVGDVPWAHLDIYAWTDGPSGPYCESGGTGQMVQALVGVCKSL